MASITLHGTPCTTNGELPAVGSEAPDFKLTDKDLNDVSLADFAGKKKIISILPSLDTPVCAQSTQKFNEHVKQYSDTVLLVVSADLPFAMGRFCTGEKLDNVVPLSMMRSKAFGNDYGVLITDGPLAGVTARAVLVLDADNRVLHAELVPEIADEPNYQNALAALA